MKTTHGMLAVLSAGVLAMMGGGAMGQDWPQWRGPNRDAKAGGFKAPKTWPKELTPKWKVSVGDGVATPSLVGDKLYVFARQDGNEILRCLDAGTGKELWQDKYDALGATGPASGFSGPRCSPTVAEGKVVTLGVRGRLSCLDAATGKVLWRKDDFQGSWPRFFTAASPLVTGGLCIAQLGGGTNGVVVAYDLATGQERWKWSGDSPAYASPVLIQLAGTPFVVAQTETKILALGVADGKVAWEIPFPVQGRGYNAATPIVDGQTLIYTGSGRGVTAVKLDKADAGVVAKELWKNPDSSVSVQFNTPVLKDGLLYGLSARNDLFCLSAQDGKTLWSAPSAPAAAAGSGQEGAGAQGGPPGGGQRRGGRGGGGGGFGSIVDAGAVLLALTSASELIAFQPGEKAFTEVARIKVSDSQTHAYPVVSGNRIFIKDRESVALLAVE